MKILNSIREMNSNKVRKIVNCIRYYCFDVSWENNCFNIFIQMEGVNWHVIDLWWDDDFFKRCRTESAANDCFSVWMNCEVGSWKWYKFEGQIITCVNIIFILSKIITCVCASKRKPCVNKCIIANVFCFWKIKCSI